MSESKAYMKNVWFTFSIAMVLLCVASVTRAQSSDPAPDRTVGAAEVFYLKDKNKTRSQVRIYLLGSPADAKANKDTVSMDVIFEVDGQKVTKPKQATVALTIHSSGKSKYAKAPDLHIHTDGIEGWLTRGWKTRLIASQTLPSGGTIEIFLSPPIDYEKILSLLHAREATIFVGEESTFTLKRADLEALKNLDQTIEK